MGQVVFAKCYKAVAMAEGATAVVDPKQSLAGRTQMTRVGRKGTGSSGVANEDKQTFVYEIVDSMQRPEADIGAATGQFGEDGTRVAASLPLNLCTAAQRLGQRNDHTLAVQVFDCLVNGPSSSATPVNV
jgi:hypothetical protein